jgi:hypothetical protein
MMSDESQLLSKPVHLMTSISGTMRAGVLMPYPVWPACH